MCYERRSLTSDEHKKAREDTNPSKEQDRRREEVVGNLLREADKASQNAKAGSMREYTPAK